MKNYELRDARTRATRTSKSFRFCFSSFVQCAGRDVLEKCRDKLDAKIYTIEQVEGDEKSRNYIL
jgi:hypothetical protein